MLSTAFSGGRRYLFFVFTRPGKLIAEVERHTYLQLTSNVSRRLDYRSY